MAYQTRQRDPLFDATTQAALEQRGKELLGLLLLGLGIVVGLMLWSYSPDDPSWMLATDGPVQNLLGRTGATIAAPLMMIVGLGSWGLAAILAVWGLRFALHRGEERAVGRLIFAPIAIALVSVYASTLVPGAGWDHTFGLGGLFGDTVLGIALTVIPLQASFGVKVMSLLSGIAIVAFAAFVLGFTWAEMRRALRFGLVGLIMLYSLILTLLGRGAGASFRAAQSMKSRVEAKREEARQLREEAEAEEVARRAVPDPGETARVAAVIRARQAAARQEDAFPELASAEPELEPEPRAGLLSKVPGLLRRSEPVMPAPELVEEPPVTGEVPAADDDRIRAKITDVVRSRMRPQPTPEHSSVAIEAAARRKGPPPLIADTETGLRPEPPLHAPSEEDALMARVASQAPVATAREVVAAPSDAASPAHDAPRHAPGQPPKLATPTNAPVHAPPPSALDTRVQHNTRSAQPSRQARAEAQPALSFDDAAPEYETPPLGLLSKAVPITRNHLSDEALEENARMLETVLDDYGVKGEIVSVRPGPVVTMYELEPAPGLKASRVIGLADDIARSMSALSARVSTVPGRSVIGIELPNAEREKVVLREILSDRTYGDGTHRLPLALGKDIGGGPVVANLAKMPHLLIAGTTGSGKSVAINTMILSLLYKLSPEECRLIMIDPKMLELSVYDGIPHLLSPVVTDPKKAVVALKWVVGEMEDRYRKMSKMGVRNIEGYNGRVRDALGKGEMFSRTVQTGFDDATGEPIFETEEFAPEAMPYIVVVVDEMADLMMVAGKEIEACIQRLAQMARASGIHLIMATQRPSVDVITGTIKANFPTRISFQVTSKVDSRTILGEQGAEQLLGMGDMLYMAGGAKITRVHGPFVSDEEVEEIVTYLKQFGPPDYQSGVVDGPEDDKESDIDAVLGLGGNTDGEDALYDQAVAIVARDRKCSTSYIQRKLAIGYNKAARLVEQMEEEGVVSPANHVGKREVLVPEVG